MTAADPKRRAYHRHGGFSYPASVGQKIYSIIIGPVIVMVPAVLVIVLVSKNISLSVGAYSVHYLLLALGATFIRLFIAYILALACTLPLALLITHNDLFERIFFPLFDIIESVPTLAFFPIVIVFFIQANLSNGAAVFILFISMLWNIVFSVVGGLKSIPADFPSVGKIFKFSKFRYIRDIELPAVFPYIVTGSLLAWAQGWNIIIVAEVLHTYSPQTSDLFGIGSTLVHAVAAGDNALFLASLITLIVGIAVLNLLVWQKLLHYAERFKFE